MYIKISTFLDSERAITMRDGEKFGQFLTRQYKINNVLQENDIIIDFAGIENFTTPFMNASICRFLINNKSAIDSISFIDSSRENDEVNDMVRLHLERLIPLALDDELRAAHDKAIDDVMNGDYDPFFYD